MASLRSHPVMLAEPGLEGHAGARESVMALIPDLTALAGVGVAGAALLVNARSSAASQRHAAAQAHQGRIWEKRADAYVALLSWSARYRETFSRIQPVLGPAPEPLAYPSDEETFLLEARIKAYGSTEIDGLLDGTLEPRARFGYNARVLSDIDARGLDLPAARATWDKSRLEALKDLENARADLFRCLDAIAARVRLELDGPRAGSAGRQHRRVLLRVRHRSG
ncbi:MAG: hypothetical protein NVS3B18_01730 [Candidatus Dormibacteria bacterium]